MNDTNFGSVFLVKCIYLYIYIYYIYIYMYIYILYFIYILIKFLMHEILLWELRLVSTVFVFAIKVWLWKNYQKWSYFTKKAPFITKIFKVLYFPLPRLGHCWFYRKSWLMISFKSLCPHHVSKLDFKETQIL